MCSRFRRRCSLRSRNLRPEARAPVSVAGIIYLLQTAMRSATVFSTKLRLPGTRFPGRMGRRRRRDANLRRPSRSHASLRGKPASGVRGKCVERFVMPRSRPVRTVALQGFAAMTLH